MTDTENGNKEKRDTEKMSDETVKMERSHRIYCGFNNEKRQQRMRKKRKKKKEKKKKK